MNQISETFKPEAKTIEQIFGDTDSFYYMPVYQRPYSWDKECIEQLWYDILNAYRNNKDDKNVDPSYFLGSIVVIKNQNGYEVVDGQQRLTTLTILFCVLRDMKLNLREENTISDSILHWKNNRQRLTLTTHLNNQAIFEETIIKSVNFNAKNKEISDNRFLQNAIYFTNLIKKSQNPTNEDYIDDFNDFIRYMLINTIMIRIVCFSESFAIKLFTVLNDRGMDLTATDIIKAHLLQNITDETKRNSFIEVWKRIENTCKLSNESMTNMFNLYLYYLKNENPKNSLQDELKLKEQFKTQDSQTIILDIENFAKNILEINSNNKDKDISMLKYLPHSIYWKSILATAKQVNYLEYQELKSLITKYYYQSWIAGGTSNRIKQTSFNILRKIKLNENILSIKEIILANIKQYDSYLKALETENAYYAKWHKPLLLAIEYYQHEEKDFISITNNVHTEHILPSEWSNSNLDWRNHFTAETAKSLLNSLGNLTLLSGIKNIQASNRNFLDKSEIYKGNNGKGFDGKTSFEITKMIIDNYSEWTPLSIQERCKWLIDEARKILDIQ